MTVLISTLKSAIRKKKINIINLKNLFVQYVARPGREDYKTDYGKTSKKKNKDIAVRMNKKFQ